MEIRIDLTLDDFGRRMRWYGQLYKCSHGYTLIDWGLNLLCPPCGCRLVLKDSGISVSDVLNEVKR